MRERDGEALLVRQVTHLRGGGEIGVRYGPNRGKYGQKLGKNWAKTGQNMGIVKAC